MFVINVSNNIPCSVYMIFENEESYTEDRKSISNLVKFINTIKIYLNLIDSIL